LNDIDVDNNRYDVFLAHAGEDKFLYVDGQLNYKLKKRCKVFIDIEAIESADLTNDNGVDRGLLTSNAVLLVMSENFICKPWPLYEFFFASARVDIENEFKIMIDSFHNPRHISSRDWRRSWNSSLCHGLRCFAATCRPLWCRRMRASSTTPIV
jgi:hypothetical protein